MVLDSQRGLDCADRFHILDDHVRAVTEVRRVFVNGVDIAVNRMWASRAMS